MQDCAIYEVCPVLRSTMTLPAIWTRSKWPSASRRGIRVRVGVADVDASVDMRTPIDKHASDQTTTVYTGVREFSDAAR